MDTEQITVKLNSILEFVDCNICPLKDACKTYEGAGNDAICNMLSDKVGTEE